MQTNLMNPAITHVFVLMLENRSFDHMLGFSNLKGIDPQTGLETSIISATAANTNSIKGKKPFPAGTQAKPIMAFDPGHEFEDVVEQLCGPDSTFTREKPYPPITNSGFASNYAKAIIKQKGVVNRNVGEVMKCYSTATDLPVLMELANQFAVCDKWFASLPGPTWPNRFFVHAASSGGLDHSPTLLEITGATTIAGFGFPNGTLYDLMNANSESWRLYRGVSSPMIGSIPCVAALKGIHIRDTQKYENFRDDLHKPYPYRYTFIEPNYGDIVNNSYSGGQSQHPKDNVRNGEALIKSTYEAIRQSPLWLNSLLIITYDEHGGFYDHFPPPTAPAPGDTQPGSKHNQHGFTFEQYGVRVPALVISAYTPKNTISHQPYDHASVPATVEAMLKLPSLTQRDAQANNVTALAALPTARTDTPEELPDPASSPLPELAFARIRESAISSENEPVDGGNLPGFLHIVMKEAAQQEVTESLREVQRATFTETINTKGEARDYLENALPRLLNTK